MNGTVQIQDGRTVLRFERRLAHPIEKIWRAVTDPVELAKWFPTSVEADFRLGGAMRFVFPESAPVPKGLTLTGTIQAWEPPRLFAFTWGDDQIRIELESEGDGCRLTFFDTLTERGRAANDGAGWHGLLNMLEDVLAGHEPAPNDWPALFEQYRQSFGAEFSSVEPPST